MKLGCFSQEDDSHALVLLKLYKEKFKEEDQYDMEELPKLMSCPFYGKTLYDEKIKNN